MRSGSASRAGKEGNEMVGAEVPDPRVTAESVGFLAAAATVAGENFMVEREVGQQRERSGTWVKVGLLAEPCNKRWIRCNIVCLVVR